MEYKLIAIDMDGTFLNSNNQLTEENKDAVLKAMEKGVKVVISTGRSVKALVKYKDEIPKGIPYIVYNGCGIIEPNSTEYIKRYDLEFDNAKKIYDFSLENNLDLLVWADDELYASSESVSGEVYRKHTRIDYEVFNDFDIFKDKGIQKLLFVYDEDVISNIYKHFTDLKFTDTNFTTSLPTIIEFFSKDGSKGNAVLEYGKSLGIRPEEIIAIGDGMNDLSMIEAVGLGIAMGNAYDEVKNKAGFVTKSNNENGVAYAIEKFVLNC